MAIPLMHSVIEVRFPPEATCCKECNKAWKLALPFPENLQSFFIVCPDCGNKRCPKATHHDNTCGNSNAAGQLGSWYGGRKENVMPTYTEALAAEENAHFFALLTDFGELLRGGDDDCFPEGFYEGYASPEYLEYLRNVLLAAGYTVKWEEEVTSSGEHSCGGYVTGKGIIAAFASEYSGNAYTEGRIAADSQSCFDKWNKCPLVMKLPLTYRREAEMLAHLAFLATPEGEVFAASDCGGGAVVPYEMD